MIRHVVLFRWKEGVTADDVAEVSASLATLPALIPEIREFQFGSDLGILEGNADYAVAALFDSAADMLAYRNHPDHVAFMTQVLAPRLDQRTAVQFDLG